MASHNAHESKRGGGRKAHASAANVQPDPSDPRDGVPSLGRGLDEETGGDTISGFEDEEEEE